MPESRQEQWNITKNTKSKVFILFFFRLYLASVACPTYSPDCYIILELIISAFLDNVWSGRCASFSFELSDKSISCNPQSEFVRIVKPVKHPLRVMFDSQLILFAVESPCTTSHYCLSGLAAPQQDSCFTNALAHVDY